MKTNQNWTVIGCVVLLFVILGGITLSSIQWGPNTATIVGIQGSSPPFTYTVLDGSGDLYSCTTSQVYHMNEVVLITSAGVTTCTISPYNNTRGS